MFNNKWIKWEFLVINTFSTQIIYGEIESILRGYKIKRILLYSSEIYMNIYKLNLLIIILLNIVLLLYWQVYKTYNC